MRAQPVDQLIHETTSLCQKFLEARGISLSVDNQLQAYVLVRGSQLAQVLWSLIANSVDAVANLSERWISVGVMPAQEGGWARIFVTDSGKGLDPDLVPKIMQPFFTTKEIGKGAGLGLSAAKGIVEEHGGFLNYDPSCPNTRFVIDLKVQPLVSPTL
jgi:C4-dicarboxylate-specific signal transduction histidine kinase